MQEYLLIVVNFLIIAGLLLGMLKEDSTFLCLLFILCVGQEKKDL